MVVVPLLSCAPDSDRDPTASVGAPEPPLPTGGPVPYVVVFPVASHDHAAAVVDGA